MYPKRKLYEAKRKYDSRIINILKILRLRIKFILVFSFERWAGLGAWHNGSGLLW